MRIRYSTLKAEGLHKQYGKRMVVKQVDVSLERGEIVGLLGPNGAGKTTTFYMITGMIKPTFGNIFLDDFDITNDAMYKRARRGIGYLAQEPSIFGKLTVEDNLKLVLEMRKDLTTKEQQDKMGSLLDDLSVSHLSKSKGNTLSGGERRRVEIARCLCMDPDFILLDEPFAGVDPIAVEEIQGIVHSLKKKEIGVLITDHNVRETLSITDRSYLLFDGQILKSGTSEFLANDEEARRLYLGEKFRLD
ncbi:MAG: LPS export ABC transporter ATP-binding protein [Candidatus Marinimicrobia bacterium]|jgi:lipopolysaccharide export system ATP-binding protein|nr:LPS export ABC transporter ATP-binding protein [Candidatus Neomarinimicrobiota bacterium]